MSPSRAGQKRYLGLAAAAAALLAGAWPARAGSLRIANADASAALAAEWVQDLHDGTASKLELALRPELDVELESGARIVVIARARADLADELEPGAAGWGAHSALSRGISAGRALEAELRELYVDLDAGDTTLRLGKQQIVWGTADGIKVLDAVNPQSFREFILEPFEESRIPLWAVNVERPIGPWRVQAVWLPDPTVHDLPDSDERYALTSPLLIPPVPPGVPVELRPTRRPRRSLADSDAGLRLSASVSSWDVSLSYLWQYEDAPVVARLQPAAPSEPLVVEPRHERVQLLGATFSRAFGDWVARGEVGLALDRAIAVQDPDEPDGVAHSRELSYVAGLDWYGMENTLVSAQLFQQVLPGSLHGLVRDSTETTASLFIRRTFLAETLEAELLALHSVNRGDGLLRARVSYKLSDPVSLWLGAHIFHGRETGLFGQFDAADAVTLGAEIRFSGP